VPGLVNTDEAVRRRERYRQDAWLVVRNPDHVDLVEGVVGGLAEVGADSIGVTADLDAVDGHLACPGGRMLSAIAAPLDEERELRILHDIENADLLPRQLETVGTNAMAGARLSPKSLLDDGDIVDGDDPAHPAAALAGALLHGAAEGRLVGGRVIECRHDLDVAAAGQGENEVSGAEGGMTASVDESRAEVGADALNSVSELC